MLHMPMRTRLMSAIFGSSNGGSGAGWDAVRRDGLSASGALTTVLTDTISYILYPIPLHRPRACETAFARNTVLGREQTAATIPRLYHAYTAAGTQLNRN